VKILTAAFVLAAATASAAPGIAKDPPKSANAEAVADLRVALDTMVETQAVPPGQANKKVDPDQGDDHASDRAIAVVCSKDNPAAEHSAICPTPVSPA
jgi:hypothetical protein